MTRIPSAINLNKLLQASQGFAAFYALSGHRDGVLYWEVRVHQADATGGVGYHYFRLSTRRLVRQHVVEDALGFLSSRAAVDVQRLNIGESHIGV